jgi:hypothetical protein
MSENNSDFELGPLKIDLGRTIRFVKQDLKDDWFLDPLRFEDRIAKSALHRTPIPLFTEHLVQ